MPEDCRLLKIKENQSKKFIHPQEKSTAPVCSPVTRRKDDTIRKKHRNRIGRPLEDWPEELLGNTGRAAPKIARDAVTIYQPPWYLPPKGASRSMQRFESVMLLRSYTKS